jgi:hypothetical protein
MYICLFIGEFANYISKILSEINTIGYKDENIIYNFYKEFYQYY